MQSSRRYNKHEETISNLVNTKVKASLLLVYENLNKPILHTATKVQNPLGLTNSHDTEIDHLKSKLEKFGDNVKTKLSYLAYELLVFEYFSQVVKYEENMVLYNTYLIEYVEWSD